jgi:hypothetical protein
MPRNQHYVRDNFTVFDGADKPSPGLSKTIEMLARNSHSVPPQALNDHEPGTVHCTDDQVRMHAALRK